MPVCSFPPKKWLLEEQQLQLSVIFICSSSQEVGGEGGRPRSLSHVTNKFVSYMHRYKWTFQTVESASVPSVGD